jgi:hypothetical protein
MVIVLAALGFWVWIFYILVSAIQSIKETALEARLKQELLDRGMAPEAIAQVIECHRGGTTHKRIAGTEDLPYACEAVVQRDGEWQAALVLAEGDGKYCVHFVGTEMDENEWVDEGRIRFASGSPLASRNGVPWKAPVEQEL